MSFGNKFDLSIFDTFEVSGNLGGDTRIGQGTHWVLVMTYRSSTFCSSGFCLSMLGRWDGLSLHYECCSVEVTFLTPVALWDRRPHFTSVVTWSWYRSSLRRANIYRPLRVTDCQVEGERYIFIRKTPFQTMKNTQILNRSLNGYLESRSFGLMVFF